MTITLRTIVTGPEAGSVIGRGGEVVNSIRFVIHQDFNRIYITRAPPGLPKFTNSCRDESGAKIRIEGSSPQERIVTVDGPTDSIFKVGLLTNCC